MADSFDPYHKWLGIPPAEQPAHHYRLLGVTLFESDLDVISHAADQRMAFVRSLQAGPQMKHSQRLLNEISAARLALLDPARKLVYDTQLRATQAHAADSDAVFASAPVVPPPAASVRTPGVAEPPRNESWQQPTTEKPWAPSPLARGSPRGRGSGRRSTWATIATTSAVGAAVGVLAVSVLVVFQRYGKRDTSPATDHSGDLTTSKDRPARANPVAATGGLRAQYQCGETAAQRNQIRMQLRVVNGSSQDIPLASLKLRYWFRADGRKKLNFWCDWAAVGKENVVATFTRRAGGPSGAEACLEIGFARGTLKAGADTGEVQCRIAADDWSDFPQAGDFSFDPRATQWSDARRVAVYRDGKLVWGDEP